MSEIVTKKQTKTCPHCSKPVTVWSLPSGYIEIEKSKTIDTSICNLCDVCGANMEVVYVREDGCRHFQCLRCGNFFGEETEKWFREMEKIAPYNSFKVSNK